MKASACAARAASTTSSRVALGRAIRMFSSMLVRKRCTSWKTRLTHPMSTSGSMSRTSTPPMRTAPDETSQKRATRLATVRLAGARRPDEGAGWCPPARRGSRRRGRAGRPSRPPPHTRTTRRRAPRRSTPARVRTPARRGEHRDAEHLVDAREVGGDDHAVLRDVHHLVERAGDGRHEQQVEDEVERERSEVRTGKPRAEGDFPPAGRTGRRC